MVSFVGVYKHMFSGQLAMRFFSFLLNFALLRLVDASLLGFFNVRMNLLYTTILFLSREPVRKLCLSSDISPNEVPLYASLSPLISMATTLLCSLAWSCQSTAKELTLSRNTYSLVLAGFSASAFVETLAEPLIILGLKEGGTKEYVRNNALLVLSQKALALGAILAGVWPVPSLAFSQLFGSLLFLWLYLRETGLGTHLCQLYIGAYSNRGHLDGKHAKLLGTFLFHSFLKQALTDGANFLMAFTELLPLKVQAIYDAIDRLASLTVRLVLQPLEESAAIYFSAKVRRREEDEQIARIVVVEFLLLTRLIFTQGTIILAFGSAYAPLAAHLYGGQLFIDNQADTLLFWYSLYLPVIAVNGISECFAVAMFNCEQVLSHARFLAFSAAIHLPLSYTLCRLLGARGFILSNIAVYALRIVFNWHFIRHRALAIHFPQVRDVWIRVAPGKQFTWSAALSGALVSLSYLYFGGGTFALLPQSIHFCCGAAMFLVCAIVFYKYEFVHYAELLAAGRNREKQRAEKTD